MPFLLARLYASVVREREHGLRIGGIERLASIGGAKRRRRPLTGEFQLWWEKAGGGGTPPGP